MLLPVRYVVGQALLIWIGIHQNNFLALPSPLDAEVGRERGFASPTFHAPNEKLHSLVLLAHLPDLVE